jgi:glycosyltransferase involved in cell wall biosynthesis
MKVIAYTKYDREAASTRQRLLQYLPALAAAGIEVDYRPLLGNDYVRSLASGEPPPRKSILAAYTRRLRQLLSPHDADLVWIYAELFPWLPGVAERLAARAGAPIVYDMDDAFFVPYDEQPRAWLRPLVRGKLEPLLSAASACTCGNAYLAAYAARFCGRVLNVPTVVDTDLYVPGPRSAGGPVVIGWIGSPSTWPQVRPLLPLLRRFCATGRVRFRVVGAGAGARGDLFEGMDLVDWREDSEIAEVQAMDIGIMPLTDSPFVRGKSGYKLIQYMGCGLPVVASPIGVNAEIVEDGRTGFLADGEESWQSALEQLVADPDLRRRMGEEGRARAVGRYSLASQAPRLIALFREIAASAAPQKRFSAAR